MAGNTLYDLGRELFLTGQLDWRDDNIQCALVDKSKYTFLPTHTNFGVVTTALALVAGPEPLVWSGSGTPNRPTIAGAADADDVTFDGPTGGGITAGSVVGAIIIYWDRGTGDADAPMLAYIDSATGMPITTNGGNIIVTWDNGINKIFRL